MPPRPDDPTGSNLRRPADVYAPSWIHGQPAAFDLAITSPQRQEVVNRASSETGYAAVAYESRKRSYLQTEEECRQQGILFVPLVAESSGGWGPSALAAFRKMAKRAAGRSGLATPAQAVLPRFLEQLCVSVRSAKARAVLRRAPRTCVGTAASEAAVAVLAADP